MTPVPLPRVGAGHGQALAESGHAPVCQCQRAARALWAEQGADALTPYVPEKALGLYKKAEIDGMYTDHAAAGRCELALLRAGIPVHDRNLLPQCGAFPRGWTTGWKTQLHRPAP